MRNLPITVFVAVALVAVATNVGFAEETYQDPTKPGLPFPSLCMCEYQDHTNLGAVLPNGDSDLDAMQREQHCQRLANDLRNNPGWDAGWVEPTCTVSPGLQQGTYDCMCDVDVHKLEYSPSRRV